MFGLCDAALVFLPWKHISPGSPIFLRFSQSSISPYKTPRFSRSNSHANFVISRVFLTFPRAQFLSVCNSVSVLHSSCYSCTFRVMVLFLVLWHYFHPSPNGFHRCLDLVHGRLPPVRNLRSKVEKCRRRINIKAYSVSLTGIYTTSRSNWLLDLASQRPLALSSWILDVRNSHACLANMRLGIETRDLGCIAGDLEKRSK